MTAKRISWKKNKIIGIELKENIFVLAQMIDAPYIIFFNQFKNENNWENVSLSEDNILFFHAVTRQFLKHSKITEFKDVNFLKNYNIPELWVISGDNEYVTVWEGTRYEKTFISSGLNNCLLVEKDIINNENNIDPSGIYKKRVRELNVNDYSVVKKYELTTIEVYPNLNERLYLCHKLNKYVDPDKEIMFKQELPQDYLNYIGIISGSVPLKDLGY